jgi:SAM-dependent methyltransferase
MAQQIDTATVEEFALSWLPQAPAQVLEVGAGTGELARTLSEAGYKITAIDPKPTEDDIVRSVSLESFDDDGPYDSVVASRSLHHIHDLEAAVEKLVGLLRPDGHLILNEFAWDRLDTPTAEWLYEQKRQGEVDSQQENDHQSFGEWKTQWKEEHADLHGFDEMLTALRRWFQRRHFAWYPYLSTEYLDGDDAKMTECDLIANGEINATGFRYVGQVSK